MKDRIITMNVGAGTKRTSVESEVEGVVGSLRGAGVILPDDRVSVNLREVPDLRKGKIDVDRVVVGTILPTEGSEAVILEKTFNRK